LSPEDEAALRDQQIDALVDDGLDRYFAGRYEDAIHLWTRVLFLDRSHARARAYIERARTALAEIQRRSDELLQASRELLEQGETEAARRLLTEAVERSGDDVQASTLLVRLERVERVRALTGPFVTPEPAASTHSGGGRRIGPVMIGVFAGVIVAIGLTAFLIQWSNSTLETSRVDATAAPQPGGIIPAPVRLPVLSSSEVALVRARTAAEHGRLSEALVSLDRVPSDSPDRPIADQLRIEYQQLLMASARSSSSTTLPEAVRR
jgi:tetratricopeptide (TPR) repeat protein